MQEINIKEIARELMDAQDNCSQLDPVTSRFLNFSVYDAYKVSRFIHEKRIEEGFLPVGRKIGFTNSNIWSIYGVCEPIWAYIYDRTVTQLTGSEATCFIGGYSEPKIEPELVVHFSASPPVGSTPSEILKCIDWVALGFEIVQSHFPGWKFKAADTVADSGLHAELFIGEPQAVSLLGDNIIDDLASFEIALSCNSKLCELGHGSNVLGSPLLAATHLISVLANQSSTAPIQAGEIVTTGTLTSAFTIDAGQVWSAIASGISLPELIIQFEI